MSPDPRPPVSDQTPTPERRWTCEKPGWMGACSPSSTHHNGFDWGCGWIYPAAPPAPTPEPEPAPAPPAVPGDRPDTAALRSVADRIIDRTGMPYGAAGDLLAAADWIDAQPAHPAPDGEATT